MASWRNAVTLLSAAILDDDTAALMTSDAAGGVDRGVANLLGLHAISDRVAGLRIVDRAVRHLRHSP